MLRQRGRPCLFSNTLAPVITYTTLEVLRILKTSTEARDKLEANTRFWRKGLTDAGFIIKEGESPIVPIMLYNAKLAQQFSAALFKRAGVGLWLLFSRRSTRTGMN